MRSSSEKNLWALTTYVLLENYTNKNKNQKKKQQKQNKNISFIV